MTSMAHITSISPERIAWCCHQLDITPDELATQVGLPAERFTVQGLHNPGLTFTQLSEVAKFLGRGVLFFTESSAPVATDRASAAQFRTFENNPPELSLHIKQLVERVRRQRQIHLHLIEDLEDEAWPMFEPPALKRNDITEAAPAVITAIAMPFTFSIAEGIAFGFISYAGIKLAAGRYRDIHPAVGILAVLFVIKYLYIK